MRDGRRRSFRAIFAMFAMFWVFFFGVHIFWCEFSGFLFLSSLTCLVGFLVISSTITFSSVDSSVITACRSSAVKNNGPLNNKDGVQYLVVEAE